MWIGPYSAWYAVNCFFQVIYSGEILLIKHTQVIANFLNYRQHHTRICPYSEHVCSCFMEDGLLCWAEACASVWEIWPGCASQRWSVSAADFGVQWEAWSPSLSNYLPSSWLLGSDQDLGTRDIMKLVNCLWLPSQSSARCRQLSEQPGSHH